MRRILETIKTDVPLLMKIEKIIYPCLVHSLDNPCISPDLTEGFDAVEIGIDCLTLILYNAYKDRPLSSEMW